MKRFEVSLRILPLIGVFYLSGLCPTTYAATNIDPDNDGHQYAYSENAGWLNLEGDGSQSGVTVASGSGLNGLSGYAWQENVGWINFGDGTPATPPYYGNATGEDFGVNLDPATGTLSGLAWSENIGWISFDTAAVVGSPLKIDKNTGLFAGSAWSENAGWITFDGLGANTARTLTTAVPVTVSGFTLE